MDTAATPPRTRWGLILAVWTGYGLFSTAQQHLGYSLSRATPPPWWVSFLLQMPFAYAWALATPGILWLGRKFPFERERWPMSVVVHLAVSLAFVFLLDILYAYHSGNVLPRPARPVLPLALQLFVVWIFGDGLLYWMVLSVGTVVAQQRRFRERQLAASQLETQLAQADLQALKMQLHPHFLFNALHTIGSLVRTDDRETAVRVLAGLGDLLRRLLEGASRQEVPLREELDFIRNYLDIEQVRFRDRLKVTIDAEPEVLDAKVPHLILQPLVENAIRHGIAPYLWAGHLLVAARRFEDRVQLLVRDDGPGAGNGEGEITRPGIGLTNTRARLTRLYGANYDLDVSNAADGGLEARLAIPFQLMHPARDGAR